MITWNALSQSSQECCFVKHGSQMERAVQDRYFLTRLWILINYYLKNMMLVILFYCDIFLGKIRSESGLQRILKYWIQNRWSHRISSNSRTLFVLKSQKPRQIVKCNKIQPNEEPKQLMKREKHLALHCLPPNTPQGWIYLRERQKIIVSFIPYYCHY